MKDQKITDEQVAEMYRKYKEVHKKEAQQC